MACDIITNQSPPQNALRKTRMIKNERAGRDWKHKIYIPLTTINSDNYCYSVTTI